MIPFYIDNRKLLSFTLTLRSIQSSYFHDSLDRLNCVLHSVYCNLRKSISITKLPELLL